MHVIQFLILDRSIVEKNLRNLQIINFRQILQTKTL